MAMTQPSMTGREWERRAPYPMLPMRFFLSVLLFSLASVLPARAASVALVLAVDVSESVSTERYNLQREGIARAFERQELLDAIAGVPDGIEALVIEWSDPEKISVTVGWTRIGNASAAKAHSRPLRSLRSSKQRSSKMCSLWIADMAEGRRVRASPLVWGP